MDDDKLLADIMRRFIEAKDEPGWNATFCMLTGDEVTLDGAISLSPEQIALLERMGVQG